MSGSRPGVWEVKSQTLVEVYLPFGAKGTKLHSTDAVEQQQKVSTTESLKLGFVKSWAQCQELRAELTYNLHHTPGVTVTDLLLGGQVSLLENDHLLVHISLLHVKCLNYPTRTRLSFL